MRLPRFTITRNPLAAVIAVAACGILIGMLFEDVRFFLTAPDPIDLGSAAELGPGPLPERAVVTVSGIPSFNRVVELRALFGRTRLFMLMGSNRLLVQQDAATPSPGLAEGTWTGRLRPLDATRGLSGIRQFFRDSYGIELDPGARVVVAGERPGDNWRAAAASLLLLTVGLFNLWPLIGWLRRRR